MKVLFSTITYLEVKERRAQALENSDSLDSLKEISIHLLFKRLPFFAVFLMYAYFIIKKCFFYLYEYIYNFFENFNLISHLPTLDIITFGFISLVVAGGIIGIVLVFSFKAIFSMAGKILPEKTPITDREYQYKSFWHESKTVEYTLRIMDEISRLSPEDIAFSDLIIEKGSDKITLLLKDSKFGYITRRTYLVLHTAMMKKLEDYGELDFTFMDEEWNNLLHKYQIT